MSDLLDAARKALPGADWVANPWPRDKAEAYCCRVDGMYVELVDECGAWGPRLIWETATIERATIGDCCDELIRRATARRDALDAAMGKAGWVPVGVRLPDLLRNVPLWTDRGLMFGARGLVESETWLWGDALGDTEALADVTVTHWLDCQPPKE